MSLGDKNLLSKCLILFLSVRYDDQRTSELFTVYCYLNSFRHGSQVSVRSEITNKTQIYTITMIKLPNIRNVYMTLYGVNEYLQIGSQRLS